MQIFKDLSLTVFGILSDKVFVEIFAFFSQERLLSARLLQQARQVLGLGLISHSHIIARHSGRLERFLLEALAYLIRQVAGD